MKILRSALALAMASGIVSQSPPDPPIGTVSQPLTGEAGMTYWPAHDGVASVPVCWETGGFDREKGIVRESVTRSWQYWAMVEFTGWDACPTSGDDLRVRIAVTAQGSADDGAGGSALVGTANLVAPGTPATVNLSFEAGSARRSRVEYVGVHEFGHVLGFGHEQDAPGNEGPVACDRGVDASVQAAPITAYDRDSVMNYCNRDSNGIGRLTDSDIVGVQAIYGVRRPRVPANNSCRSAPVRPRGTTASIGAAWNNGGLTSIAIFPSDGTQFLTHEHWSIQDGGWGDTVKWMAGDFDGNGLTDIGAAWNNGGTATLTVRLTQPDHTVRQEHWLASAGGWRDSSIYMAGDFNGDGLSDVAGVWDNGGQVSIAVFLSDGASFPGWTQWSDRDGGFHPMWKWMAGDFDGDGKDDIGAAWGGQGNLNLTVRRSTGSGFVQEHWLIDGGHWWEASAFLAGDFTGDGRADIAQMWNDLGYNSITVYESSGTSFTNGVVRAERDGGVPLDIKWLAADFNGDTREDIAAVWENQGATAITVRLSTISGFQAAHWSEANGGWIPSTAWCAGRFA